MSQKNDDSSIGLLILLFIIIVAMPFAGPAAIVEKSKDSSFMKVFIWIFIRCFWFGFGFLSAYLFMR